jgi:PTS system fructose-specific IIC component
MPDSDRRAPIWRKPCWAAAQKAHLELIDNPNDAELAIVLGTALPADSALNGKKVFLGDINRAVAHPELFLSEAKAMRRRTLRRPRRHCRLPPVAKRIVAVTACPTGVAHTFMAAEAIETEAKKRGWWVKVETAAPSARAMPSPRKRWRRRIW